MIHAFPILPSSAVRPREILEVFDKLENKKETMWMLRCNPNSSRYHLAEEQLPWLDCTLTICKYHGLAGKEVAVADQSSLSLSLMNGCKWSKADAKVSGWRPS